MLRSMLKSKIHRATVTESNINYEGSLTVDRNLMDEVNLIPSEHIQVYNIHNGERFETYVIEGPPGSGIIGGMRRTPPGVSKPYRRRSRCLPRTLW